jgi:hypothetical protein
MRAMVSAESSILDWAAHLFMVMTCPFMTYLTPLLPDVILSQLGGETFVTPALAKQTVLHPLL